MRAERNKWSSIGKVSVVGSIGIILGLCLTPIVVMTTNGQQKTSTVYNRNGSAQTLEHIDKSKPSIVLSYEGEEIVDENCSLKKEPSYLLRLFNNTRRPINVDANYSAQLRTATLFLPDGTKALTLLSGTRVTLCYQVEPILTVTSSTKTRELSTEIPTERDIPELPAYCRCAWSQQRTRRDDDYPGIWIASGSSIVFPVPKKYLADGLKVYTLFDYDWEFENGRLRPDEPHHQVFFYSTDLRPRNFSQVSPSKNISPK